MSFDVEKYKDEVSSEDNRHNCKVTLQNGLNEKNLTENPDEHSDDTTDRYAFLCTWALSREKRSQGKY